MGDYLQRTNELVINTNTEPVLKNTNNIRIISLNINGLTDNYMNKSEIFDKLLEDEQPDIICLQETKCSLTSLQNITRHLFKNYKLYYSKAKKYELKKSTDYQFGTAILIKNNINYEYNYVDITELLPKKHEQTVKKVLEEGRINIVEINEIVLINVYVPFSLNRSKFRTQFDNFFRNFVKHQFPEQRLIIAGDFNSNNEVYQENIPGCKRFEVENFHKLQDECELKKVNMTDPTILGPIFASQIDHFLIRGVSYSKPRVLTNYYEISDHIPIAIDVRK
ncbi:Endonuclease/Exonuclease/phosphatase_family protein [Hexamita inflata]|uniref:Endonuclease/Exonuclease/phosphatase family protein n=1 Tax=Hexamita inflata TaxID=28002 RepID=A0AA86U4U2_9EUKA|nr:Endonuclease/Exonuclease/phosphatase family protein [Hexamita inflata]